MRGLPASGKSYRAKELAGDKGLIFSTDEYWYKIHKPELPDEYSFKLNMLGVAHKWNQLRANRAVDVGEPLIIIDNTNTTISEIRPYASYAHFQGYKVCIEEPTSPWWQEIRLYLRDKRSYKRELREWAFKLEEMSKASHNVPWLAFEKMMRRWDNNVTPERLIDPNDFSLGA